MLLKNKKDLLNLTVQRSDAITWAQVKTIAEIKMPDLNAFKVESAMKMVAGTARSLGITVSGTPPWDK